MPQITNDEGRGLYDKFTVRRKDGSSCAGGKHEHCRYFVLDLTHDPFAVPAITAYAMACRHKFPQLSFDLFYMLAHCQASEKPEE